VTSPQQEKIPQTRPNGPNDQKIVRTNPLTRKHATHQLLSTLAAQEAHTVKAENFGHRSPRPDNTAHLLILTHRHPRESWAQQLRPRIPLSLPDSPPPPLPLPLLPDLPPLAQLLPPPLPMPGSDLGWLWQPPSVEMPLEGEAHQEEEEEAEEAEEDHPAHQGKDL
jgi:hypothetical protein